jgi:hypothetical protein
MEPVISSSLTDTSGRFRLYFFAFMYYTFAWQFFTSSCDHSCATYYFVIMKHESNCECYDSEVKDISVNESGSGRLLRGIIQNWEILEKKVVI